MRPTLAVALLPLFLACAAPGGETTVTMHLIDPSGVGAAIGTITLADVPGGLRLTPNLTGLPPGPRGFHVHEAGSCAPAEKDGKVTAGVAAGGHLDPAKTGAHLGPEGQGHLGDMPVLTVSSDGTAHQAVVAPRLSVAQVRGRSLMIHAGGDNYADQPQPLGGGGARLACGVIP